MRSRLGLRTRPRLAEYPAPGLPATQEPPAFAGTCAEHEQSSQFAQAQMVGGAEAMTMTTGRTLLLIFALLVPPGIAAVAERSQRYPRRYAEVIPGKLYRGGFPTARHIRNLAADKAVKTVLSLTGTKPEPKYTDEAETTKALGMRLLRVAMPGNGCADFEDLDRAADAIGNKANWPLFFHCDAGKQRSNAALAAYRLRKCGWTIEQALEELKNDHDLDPTAERELVEHLRRYAALAARPPRPLGAGSEP